MKSYLLFLFILCSSQFPLFGQALNDSAKVLVHRENSRVFEFQDGGLVYECQLELVNFSWLSSTLQTLKGWIQEKNNSNSRKPVVGFRSIGKISLYRFANSDSAENFLNFASDCSNIWDCEQAYHSRKDFLEKWTFNGTNSSHVKTNGDSLVFNFPYPRNDVRRRFEYLRLRNGDTLNLKGFRPMQNFSVVSEYEDRVVLHFRYTSNTFNPNGRCGAGEEKGLLCLKIVDAEIIDFDSYYMESCYQDLYFNRQKILFENDFYYFYELDGGYAGYNQDFYFRPAKALVSQTETYVKEEATLVLVDDISDTIKADIKDLGWIAGHWQGEAFGGIIDEVWLPPLGQSMLGTFKLVKDGKDGFMEILTISETPNGSLELSLRHFNPDLVAWEKKEEVLRFPLLRLERHRAYFRSFTFELLDEDRLNIHALFIEDGQRERITFAYTRVKK